MSKKTSFLVLALALACAASSQAEPAVGEAFGKPVAKSEFDSAYKTAQIFSTSGAELKNEDEKRAEAWRQIVLLREADRQGTSVTREELETELKRLLSEKQITYGSYNYHEFVKTSFSEDAPAFEKRVENVLRVNKLMKSSDAKALEDIVQRAAMADYQTEKRIVVETNQGNFELRLFPSIAPKAVENFIGLAEKKYYDGIVFHRVIKGFMIQGGDPTATGRGGESIWGKTFEDEVRPDLTFSKPGLLAMANSGPSTNGSQFFITLAPTPHLNMKHTIFGEVVSGYEIVQKIGETATGEGDRPVQEQKIQKLYLKSWPNAAS